MHTFLKNSKVVLMSMLVSIGASLIIILPVLLFDLLTFIFRTR